MIFGTPISWFLYEVLSVVLFVASLVHATRRTNATLHVLTLVGFVIYSGIFENIGVWSGSYTYSVDRVMMIGTVPLSILFIEAAIFYAATWLTSHLRIRWWAAPIVIGLMGAFQDLTIDPSNVFDLHTVDGHSSGQWNWTAYYDGGLFGIPVSNFSGWMTMMLYFALSIAVIRRIADRRNRPTIAAFSPLLAIIPSMILLVTVNLFLLSGMPFAPIHTMVAEIIMLVIDFGVGIFLLFRLSSLTRPLSLRRDWLMFAVPVALHVWDIVIAYSLHVQQGYLPSVLFGAIHIALLALVVIKGRARARALDPSGAEREFAA